MDGRAAEEQRQVEVTEEMINADLTESTINNIELFYRVIDCKYKRALEKKDEGNKHYSAKDYKLALQIYKEGLILISFDNVRHIQNPSIRAEILDLFTKMLNNVAQCFIALEKYDEALDVCEKVSQLNPAELKSYYRAGLCLRNMGKLKESYLKLEEGTKIASQFNVEITPEYRKLKYEISKQYNEDIDKQREMYARVFGKDPQKKEGKPQGPDAKDQGSSLFRSSVHFTLFAAIAAGTVFGGLEAFPLTKQLDIEEKLMICGAAGSGLAGLVVPEKVQNKIMIVSTIGAAVGFLFYTLKHAK
jgi:tetratricopeptide (TPR) repeat protein